MRPPRIDTKKPNHDQAQADKNTDDSDSVHREFLHALV